MTFAAVEGASAGACAGAGAGTGAGGRAASTIKDQPSCSTAFAHKRR